MSVLGIDTGNRTFGWALFNHARRCFDALGAMELEPAEGVQKTDDQGDRAITIVGVLVEHMHACDLVVAERMSFPPGGTVPIALGFGGIVGLARALRKPLYTAKPQTWQRAVLPNSGKKVDYRELEAVVGTFVRRNRDTAIALDSLASGIRTHALDACAIAMMGAFRLNECRLVKERMLA